MDLVLSLASKLFPPSQHGRPGGPTATLVGGRGSEDRGNPGRARHDPRNSLSNHLHGQGSPHTGEALGQGDSLLLGAAYVGGGSGPRAGAGDSGQSQPGWKGEYHALAILRPGRTLFDTTTSVHLPGQSAHRGPPPCGGDPRKGLRGTALRPTLDLSPRPIGRRIHMRGR